MTKFSPARRTLCLRNSLTIFFALYFCCLYANGAMLGAGFMEMGRAQTQPINQHPQAQKDKDLIRIFPTGSRITSLQVSKDGRLLLGASERSKVELINTQSWHIQWQYQLMEHDSFPFSIKASARLLADGKTIVAGLAGKLIVLDVPSRRLIHTLESPNFPVMDLKDSLDGKMLAVSNGANTVTIWNTYTWSKVDVFHLRDCESLDWSPDGALLAVGTMHNQVILFDVKKKSLRRIILPVQNENSGVQDAFVAFRSNKELVVACDGDGTIAHVNGFSRVANLKGHIDLFDTGSLKMERSFEHNWQFSAIALSPSGKTLAVGSIDHKLRLVSLLDGRVLTAYKEDKGYEWALAYFPDGKRLASSDRSNALKVWRAWDEPARAQN